MTPTVSVIIVNFNSGDRLSRVLACLAAQTFADFNVIVFDNASQDGSAQIPLPDGVAVRVMRHDTNIGFAAGNNLASRHAEGAWLAFLNPDAYPEPSWLAELMSAAERYPQADAFGSTQIDATDPSRLDGAGDGYHFFGVPYRGHFGWPIASLPPEGECFAPCAAAALYRSKAFRSLGGFDERFFCYGEDVDLGFRLRLAGGRAVQAPRARVHHEGSGLTGRHSEFTIYHGHRNRIWTFVKNMPPLLFWLALPFHVAVNLFLLARMIFIGRGRAYLRALKDAVGGLGEMMKTRRSLQSSRTASTADIARVLTWSPLAASRRRAVIRKIT